MRFVQPIRDKVKIEEMKKSLKRRSHRDYLLFALGINTGLRISDILMLCVGDVNNRDFTTIKEQKTGKTRRVIIPGYLRKEIAEFAWDMKPGDKLFQSRKGSNQPIGRVQAYRILNSVAAELGLEEIGTHTLRKTFGYWHYQKNKDVAILQQIFNHSSPSITLRYIGITQDMIQKSLENFSL